VYFFVPYKNRKTIKCFLYLYKYEYDFLDKVESIKIVISPEILIKNDPIYGRDRFIALVKKGCGVFQLKKYEGFN
jgi:hypothetical protein